MSAPGTGTPGPGGRGSDGPPGRDDAQSAFVAALVDELARAGVRHAVVCPGSRSTPLALGLAAHGGIEVHVRLDERSAAFVALGIGLATGVPAVLVTTSGTAAAEAHPAVVEADLGRVPLLVCTADRPPELRGVGAPQTIDQERLFGTAPRWFADPGVPDPATSASWRSLGARAVVEARYAPAGPGPVHLNLPFREPLVGAFGPGSGRHTPVATVRGRPDGEPWHRLVAGTPAPPRGVVAELAERARAGQRGIIVAGAGAGAGAGGAGGGAPDEGLGGANAVWALAEAAGWPVLADPRSEVWSDRPGVISAVDLVVRSDRFLERNRPDLVVRLGVPWASRPALTWLDELAASGVPTVAVDPIWRWIDPGHVVTELVRADPGLLCAQVAAELVARPGSSPGPESDYLGAWRRAHETVQGVLAGALDGPGGRLVEPGVARSVVRSLPTGSTLVVSSSMPIRDVEAFAAPRPDRVRILANRGANGIDGVTSTAMGVAIGCGSRHGTRSGGAAGQGAEKGTGPGGGPVVAILGDLAFLHDVSALVHAASTSGAGLTLVVVDNGGGGIFSFLSQARELDGGRFEELFGTPPSVDVVQVARGFGIEVDDVADVDGLADALDRRVTRRSNAEHGLSVVRVRVPDRAENVEIHAGLVDAVRTALDALV